jgi:hypothetical protein
MNRLVSNYYYIASGKLVGIDSSNDGAKVQEPRSRWVSLVKSAKVKLTILVFRYSLHN